MTMELSRKLFLGRFGCCAASGFHGCCHLRMCYMCMQGMQQATHLGSAESLCVCASILAVIFDHWQAAGSFVSTGSCQPVVIAHRVTIPKSNLIILREARFNLFHLLQRDCAPCRQQLCLHSLCSCICSMGPTPVVAMAGRCAACVPCLSPA